tara:strand:- start:1226 stop:1573 length:348 start_codon:yes stop_codon:yes gene_type:complete
MNWPPKKSWTSKKPINGFKHFVAFNYGGKDFSRWVLLVAVLDGKTRLKLSWEDIMDSRYWIQGWSLVDFTKEDIEYDDNEFLVFKDQLKGEEICLHPSKDSGFQIPTTNRKIRKW